MKATELSIAELSDALLLMPNHAPHAYAARNLVVTHRAWLHRLEFREAMRIEIHSGLIYADIDWPTATRLVDILTASESESAVLRFACVLLGQGPAPAEDDRWSMRYILRAIHHDRDSSEAVSRLVITAFVTAATGGQV